MAEFEKPDPTGLELDTSTSRRELAPSMQGARSANRRAPLPEGPRQATGTRLREGAVETLFNSAGILADVIDDFRRQDRFFKYKALVLGLWAVAVASSVGVACIGQQISNDIGAHLVVSGDDSHPVYMVKNESDEEWREVEVTVNGRYRCIKPIVEPNVGSITLSGGVLYDEQGRRPPSSLRITDIVVRVGEPEGEAVVLRDGTPIK